MRSPVVINGTHNEPHMYSHVIPITACCNCKAVCRLWNFANSSKILFETDFCLWSCCSNCLFCFIVNPVNKQTLHAFTYNLSNQFINLAAQRSCLKITSYSMFFQRRLYIFASKVSCVRLRLLLCILLLFSLINALLSPRHFTTLCRFHYYCLAAEKNFWRMW